MGGVVAFLLVVSGPAGAGEDWVKNAFTMGADGKGKSGSLPFSFRYNGVDSQTLLTAWPRSVSRAAEQHGEFEVYNWQDPESTLLVECRVRTFADNPAVEWILYFRNSGTENTKIIEDILTLNGTNLPGAVKPRGNPMLRYSNGDRYFSYDYSTPTYMWGETRKSFMKHDQELHGGMKCRFASKGSFRYLPFFNVKYPEGGWVVAVGWSGNWAAEFEHTGEDLLAVRVGMGIKTRFYLKPGEEVRGPSVVILPWSGHEMIDGHNQFRKLVIDHYVPRQKGQPTLPPLAGVAMVQVIRQAAAKGRIWEAWWDDYNEKIEYDTIPKYGDMGFEAIWMDAWWFPQPWQQNLGNWYPRPDAFAGGIKPIADLAHQHGMDYLLWMIPMSVNGGTQWAKEYPQYIHGGGEGRGGIWKLGEPEAREKLTDLICGFIQEWGINIYREDGSDIPSEEGAEDRQGIAEMKHIDGLYQFYSGLLRRNPGLKIDSCCGGGNRIDIETMKRCYYLHRSDLNDWPAWSWPPNRVFMGTGNQNLIGGLSLYVPLHAGPTWEMEPYSFRSNFCGGGVFCVDLVDKNFPVETAKQAIAELRMLRPLVLGDFYPLLQPLDSDEVWYACQWDRPDLGKGCAMVFRRPLSGYKNCEISLRNIDPDAQYEVSITGETYEYGSWQRLSGKSLQTMEITIPEKPGSVLIHYKKTDPDHSRIIERSLLSKGNVVRLQKVMARLQDKQPVTVGVIGGSITQGALASSPDHRWADIVAKWWREHSPAAVKIKFINAGIGATGSDLGTHRVQKHLLKYQPDFVVIEYAVNDNGSPRAAETLEGLTRQILAMPNQPAVMLFFTMDNQGNNVQTEHMRIGNHYDLPMVSMRDALWLELQAGRMQWDDIEADTVHPNDKGHALCAEFIVSFLDSIWTTVPSVDDLPDTPPLPEPLISDIYEHAAYYDAESITPAVGNGWAGKTNQPFFNGWTAETPGSTLEFEVAGTTISLIFHYTNQKGGIASVQVDDLPPVKLEAYFSQDWGGGYSRFVQIADHLPAGPHRLKITLLEEKSEQVDNHQFEVSAVLAAGITEK